MYQKYMTILDQASGTLSDKIDALMMRFSDEWGWEGSQSIIADMLDCEFDVHSKVAILEAALRHECQTDTMQAAIQAIQDCSAGMMSSSSNHQASGVLSMKMTTDSSGVLIP